MCNNWPIHAANRQPYQGILKSQYIHLLIKTKLVDIDLLLNLTTFSYSLFFLRSYFFLLPSLLGNYVA